MQLEYHLVDVFTDKQLGGNTLAIVMKADHLSDMMMQSIAREFNFSETVFVRQPEFERHTAGLRVFTPSTELQFAGHPTIGAAVLLGLQNRASAVRLEEKVGTITCVMERIDRRTGTAKFGVPVLPSETAAAPTDAAIARALGIDASGIGFGDYRPSVWSAGPPFCLVPVKDPATLAEIDVERRGWAEVFSTGARSVYVFTPATMRGFDYSARMFAPHWGMSEDPATGAAAAALAGLIASKDPDSDTQRKLRISQGVEMGRPSEIELTYRKAEGKLTNVGIGGSAVIIANGMIDLA